MGKAPEKKGKGTWAGRKNQKLDKYISRAAALKRLQISLKDFRRLCILKGIFPRVPNKRKGFATGRTYYFTKDIVFLQHEPLLEKYRELKIFSRKLKKAKSKHEQKAAKALISRVKPILTFDHLIKERYPSFESALRDLDDCLTLMTMVARIDSRIEVKVDTQLKCVRLLREFQNYVVLTRSLRKVFLSVKGIYYQAEVFGVPITWLAPYEYHQEVPKEVDFRIIKTFLEFYMTLIEFVNFKLYHTIGMAYPPNYSVHADDAASGLSTLVVLSEDNHKPVPQTKLIEPPSDPLKRKQQTKPTNSNTPAASGLQHDGLTEEQKKSQEDRLKSLLNSDKMKSIVAADKQASAEGADDSDSDIDSDDDGVNVSMESEATDTSLDDIDDVQGGSDSSDDEDDEAEDEDGEEDSDDEEKQEQSEATTTAVSQESAETFVEYEQRPDVQKKMEMLERYKRMFEGLVFFVSRECPRSALEFVIKCYGGQVCWDGRHSPYPADSPKITHHIIDRPAVDNMVQSREYIQPQWVFDCVNAQLRLPLDRYRPGARLPPHLSPFVDYTQQTYVPRYAQEIRELVAKETGLNSVPGSENADDTQEELTEEQIDAEERFRRELEAERSGIQFSKAKEEGLDKEILKPAAPAKLKTGKNRVLNEPTREEEERKLKESMLSRKKFKLYDRARKQLQRKDKEANALEQRRIRAEQQEEEAAQNETTDRIAEEAARQYEEHQQQQERQRLYAADRANDDDDDDVEDEKPKKRQQQDKKRKRTDANETNKKGAKQQNVAEKSTKKPAAKKQKSGK